MRARLGNTRRSASGQQPLASEDQLQARNAGACEQQAGGMLAMRELASFLASSVEYIDVSNVSIHPYH